MKRGVLAGALLAVAAVTAFALAQVRVGSGRALDDNLRIGSGGYNAPGRGAVVSHSFYRPLYSVSRPWDVRSDSLDTYFESRRYDPERSTGAYRSSPRIAAGGGRAARSSAEAPRVGETGSEVFANWVRQRSAEIGYGVGYFLGREIRRGLKVDGVEADAVQLMKGFTDGLESRAPAIAEDDLRGLLLAVHDEMQRRMVNRLLLEDPEFANRHDANFAESDAFLETFRKQRDVVVLPDGIAYRILRPGTGPRPDRTDVVIVNVRLLADDGRELGRWEGADLHLDRAIKAGARVLPLMRVGARWQVAIPPQMAHGAAGLGPVGPNESLLAEVELVGIKEL